MGIAGFVNGEIFVVNSYFHSSKKCFYQDSVHFSFDDIKDSFFEEAVLRKKDVVVRDLSEVKNRSPHDERIFNKGVKNLIITPLLYENEVIGTMYLASQRACSMCGTDLYKLNELKPLFSLSLQRSIEQFENDIKLVIQNKFTSIHPAVEWKFKEVATRYLDHLGRNTDAIIEPIVFENIYPLFGVSDIRGSSTYRNKAIQNDIIEHLNIILKILESAYKTQEISIVDEMIFRCKQHLKKTETELSSGDEIEIINFISREIEPSLSHFKLFSSATEKLIADYYELKDNQHNTIYKQRKAFDDSVSQINKVFSSYLESAQLEAQNIFPHYFEKQSTDGIDFSIYIGKSLAGKFEYYEIYLKNLRLWQIIVLANIAKISVKLKQKTPVSLDTTHLLVIQDFPITISFDFEEKGFRVEGAYNIRYEIIKKRIDKATIIKTNERLTQPNMIAMVYTQQKEKEEYIRYIEYLVSKQILEDSLEVLELNDLQGVKGLKALRVNVNIQNDNFETSIKSLIDEAF
jgi:hypothetical protein